MTRLLKILLLRFFPYQETRKRISCFCTTLIVKHCPNELSYVLYKHPFEMLGPAPQFIWHCQYGTGSFLPFLAHPARPSYTLRAVVFVPRGCVQTRVSHFPSHSRAVSQQVAAVQQRCSRAGEGPSRNAQTGVGRGEEAVKTNRNITSARFGSRCIGKRAALQDLLCLGTRNTRTKRPLWFLTLRMCSWGEL